jgi:uncharacterized membrane protein
MPYHWPPQPDPQTEALRLVPHRSLSARGFVWFIGATATLLALPLLTQLGSAALWVLLPFLAAAVAGVWIAIRFNNRTVSEDLTLTADLITLHRHTPGRADQTWTAHPHWVRTTLHPSDGPVPNYLTLTGGGREVELGAFLTPQERRELHVLLLKRLSTLRSTSPPLD